MADVMRKEASEMLRDISSSFEGSSSVLYRPTWGEVYQSLPTVERNRFLIAQAAVSFACLLPEIEMALVYRFFNTKGFYDEYNAAIAGTILPSWEAPTESTEALTDEQHAKLIKRAKKDSSFSSFFYGEGVADLPSAARERLESQGLLDTIDNLVAPSYYSAFREVYP